MNAGDLALGIAATGTRAALDAARIAATPARVALAAPISGPVLRRARRDLEAQGALVRARLRVRVAALIEEALDAPEMACAFDRVLQGPLMDALARSIAEHRVLERMAAQIVATSDVERLVADALNSPLIVAVTERVMASAEMDRLVEHIASSPEVRRALTRQSTSLAEEFAGGMRRRTMSLDDAAERTVRGWLRRPKPRPA